MNTYNDTLCWYCGCWMFDYFDIEWYDDFICYGYCLPCLITHNSWIIGWIVKSPSEKQFIEYYIEVNKEIFGFEVNIWNMVFKCNYMCFIKFIKCFESDLDRFHIEINVWSE